MKRLVTVFITVLAVLSILGSSTTALAASQQPKRPPYPQAPAPQSVPYLAQHLAAAPQNDTSGAIGAQAIALAKPGTSYRWLQSFGHSTDGYTPDFSHLNGVAGMTMDESGNLYTTEEYGARLVKWSYDPMLAAWTAEWSAGNGSGFHVLEENGMAWPRDVKYDAINTHHLWVADDSVVIEYGLDGSRLQQFPNDPWASDLEDNLRFNTVRGITFDTAGHMFLSDQNRHRIQVFTFDPMNTPVYLTTIGETDVSGNDTGHFDRPAQISVDSFGRLYVDDVNNNRIMRCEAAEPGSLDWPCEVFYDDSTSPYDPIDFPDGLGGLINPYAVSVDPSNNVFIGDSGHNRILKCNLDSACTLFDFDVSWPAAFAFNDSGSMFVSAYGNFIIRRYISSDGSSYDDILGTPGEPYATAPGYIYTPAGIDVDAKGNMYVTEQHGQRLIKLSPAGTPLWTFGIAGHPDGGDSTTQLGDPRAVAVNKAGTSLIVLNGGGKVMFLNPATGNFVKSFGEGWGEGDYQFKDPRGVVFDSLNNFYIADAENQVVKKFSPTGTLLFTLGWNGWSGRDNTSFNRPYGVAVDLLNNFYVADHDNCRVQKFSPKGVYLMTFGTRMCGDNLDRMGGPSDVAVDSAYRVYVANEWSNNIQVYDKTGAYLTTIGGEWSQRTGGLRSLLGIAVTPTGTVYAADTTNNRIEKFTLNVPNAKQKNINGFGNRANESVQALVTFKTKVYAATRNFWGRGAQILRQNGALWDTVMGDGFDNTVNDIEDLAVFKNYLYASGDNGSIWRSPDGLTWEPVTTDGFGQPDISHWIKMNVYMVGTMQATLCAMSGNWNGFGDGAEMWCTETGEADMWWPVIEDGFGNPNNTALSGWAQKGSEIYVGTLNPFQGAQLWRLDTGKENADWEMVSSMGFGDPSVVMIGDMAYFNKRLYIGTGHESAADNNWTDIEGASIISCAVCDGSDFTQIQATVNGFGNSNNVTIDALQQVGTTLWAVTANYDDGLELWRTTNGTTWKKFGVSGFGSSSNVTAGWDNTFMVQGSNFMLGTNNWVNGGQVWKVCPGLVACN